MNFSKLFTVFLGVVVILPVQAADWPIYRGPDQNGISRESVNPELIVSAQPLWKANVGIGFSSITIAEGRAYTMGNAKETDTVWCLDATTGKELWKHSYPEKLDANLYEGGPSATPTVSEGRVYTLSKSGRAFCFDGAKGTILWEKDLAKATGAEKPQWGFASSPVIHGDMVLLNVGAAGAAVRKATGDVIWKSGTGKAGYSTPLVINQGGDQLALIMTLDMCVAFRVSDGKTVWSHPWKTSYDINAADPIVLGNRVFVSAGYDHGASVFRVEGDKTTTVWANQNLRNQFSSSVLLNGFLYGMDENQLRCLDFATGDVKWTEKSTGKGSLIMAGGQLVVLGEKGELIIADASSDGFKPLSRAQILTGKCWTAPTLANGRLYARNAKGDIVCVQVGAK